MQTVSWLVLAVFCIWRHVGSRGLIRRSHYSEFYGIAFLAAILLIGARVVTAAFFGSFSTSPYDHSIMGLFRNLIGQFPVLFVREAFRSEILFRVFHMRRGWKRGLLAAFITACFISVELNYAKLASMQELKTFVIYLFEVILPLVMEHIFLSVLDLYGSCRSGFCYAALLTAFEWYFPVLPNVNWLAETVYALILPALFLMQAVDRGEILQGKRRRTAAGRKGQITGYISLAFCVGIIWFFAGVFPVYPSVVLTGSMQPVFDPGDMVLIEKISSEEQLQDLKAGDVINFKRDEINISHRILQVIEEDGGYCFQTKGDNNSSEDVRLVKPEEVRGIIHHRIPHAGLLILWLKSSDSQPDDVEF